MTQGRLVGERTRCRSCDAAVFWMETTNGKLMPVDVKPERRLVVVSSDDHLTLGSDDQEHKRVRSVPTYTSHFATCPNADQHRRTR